MTSIEMLVKDPTNQACDFSGFYRNSGFLKKFLPEKQFMRFTYKRGESRGTGREAYYLHLFY